MSRLNYHHLYYFWRVAVVGNLTQVAKELHLSQSALSTQIRALEQRYGVKLFDRVGRTLRLTDAGQRVLKYAQDIFSTGDELEQVLKFGVVTTKQSISIGVLTHLSRNFVEGFIAPLLAKQNVQIKLSSRGLVNLLDGLVNHEFDFVLTNRMVGNDNNQQAWQHQLLRRQAISIVGPAGQKPDTAFPLGYDNINWVLPATNTEVRSAFDSICAVNQYKATILAEADDMAMLRLLSRDSGACAVLPPLVVLDELKNGLLEEYQVLPNAYEHFYAISLPKKHHSDAVLDLLRLDESSL
ncbi:LysR family transcriptional regulator [Pseudoalteromonas sp. JBTF-M23]|uniref:LysR family transcriptional regulator n=1 Tax=Pseudoalteromonas caenipelagi TaxID=2726988 RepID=A0A849V8Y4_9GAMM|nr:LysR family transcriptional regulator [Pseudoalteromonas caenipelagi]NOU49792.1 LysR family transcriptional regulator [Pseudoalteromonas caenipelagi]